MIFAGSSMNSGKYLLAKKPERAGDSLLSQYIRETLHAY